MKTSGFSKQTGKLADFTGRMNMKAEDVEDLSWLKSMMKQELDLRPPSLARLGKNSIIIRNESDKPVGHVTVSNRWQGFEINSLFVDPAHRGEGLSHVLLSKIEKSRVFCYTRDSRLQTALVKAGYSRARFPGFIAILNLILTRTAMVSWMLLTFDLKRIYHQIRNLSKYKLYMKLNTN